MIKDLLQNKTAKEKANIKGLEIAKVDFRGEHTSGKHGVRIDIQSIKAIEGGVEVLARAWKGSKQLGFGKDGSVEIERFRIFNPPILVDDPNGTIIRVGGMNSITGEKQADRKLKEDPAEAIRRTIAHNVSLVGKEDTNILKGKVGNTESTFYSDTGGDAGPSIPNQSSFANARNATSVSDTGTSAVDFMGAAERETTGSDFNVARGFFPFDTSGIDDADTIDSVTFTLTKAGGENPQTAGVILTTQVSGTSYAAGDFDNLTLDSPDEGTDSRVDTNVSNDTTFDFVFNATGISWIDKTGFTKLGTRYTGDIDNVTPPNSTRRYTQSYYSDEAGTDKDPTLVVTHSGAGPATLKTWNTIDKA